MLEKVDNKTIAVWPDSDEKAYLVRKWNGSLEIKQGDQEVIFGDGDIDELIKAIRAGSKIVIE